MGMSESHTTEICRSQGPGEFIQKSFYFYIASIVTHFSKATILLLNVLSINLILNKLFSLFRSASNPVREARHFEGAQYNGPIGTVNNCASPGSCHNGKVIRYDGPITTVNNCAATGSCGKKKRSITQAQTDSE